LPLKLWIDGNKFFALIDPIGFVGKRRKPIQAKRFGIDNGDRAVVTSAYAPKLEQSILTKQPIIDTLVIPKDCTPNYDPASPKKEIMLKTVVGTIQIKLSNFVRQGIAKYPRNLTILIADFNVDYPSTYVRVEGINEVYSVTLHDFENYDSDQFEREGEYPFGEVYNKSKELLAKIHKHGIRREITITP